MQVFKISILTLSQFYFYCVLFINHRFSKEFRDSLPSKLREKSGSEINFDDGGKKFILANSNPSNDYDELRKVIHND